MFENPYGVLNQELAEEICLCDSHRQKAREIATESMVLLKNNGVLPLSGKHPISLIGPFAKENRILGAWRALGREKDAVSLYDGFAEMLPEDQIFYAKGCEICGTGKINEDEVLSVMEKGDVIVLALGEDQDMSGEAASRSEIGLPGCQKQLVSIAAKTGKPVVVVLFSGRPLAVEGWIGHVDALLEAWFPGTEGGHAVADIITGKVNPSGRLVMSFPRNEGQIPVYYNCFSTGRPCPPGKKDPFSTGYLDVVNEPLFPFGYGLSYTKFTYKNIKVDKMEFFSGQVCNISVEVENSGSMDGWEVVQLYIRDEKACVVRPVRELKGFSKIFLKAGEKKKVEFCITEEMLKFYDRSGNFIIQPGKYMVYIGKDSTCEDSVEISYVK